MDVIASFVDYRSGKRYHPGDAINPPLEKEQTARLKAAGCIAIAAPEDLASLKVAELKELAASRGVDIADCKNKDDLIAALELAAEEASK